MNREAFNHVLSSNVAFLDFSCNVKDTFDTGLETER